MTLYFAYGSNMDPAQMARRCPGSTFAGIARLPDHRLTFTWESVRWGGGVGHVEPSPGDEVWGVVWDLNDAHVTALDEYEGVAQGVYERAEVDIEAAGGHARALIYIACSTGYQAPSKRYVDALVRGATAFDLPPAYIERLTALAPGP